MGYWQAYRVGLAIIKACIIRHLQCSEDGLKNHGFNENLAKAIGVKQAIVILRGCKLSSLTKSVG